MKVSERIKEIRGSSGNAVDVLNKAAVLAHLIQLEVEIVEALQVAREGAYQAGRQEQIDRNRLQY